MPRLPRPLRRARLAATVALGATGALLAGCGGGSQTATPAASKSVATQSQDSSLHAALPDRIKSSGVVRVATDASYAPNEFFAPDNKTIIGMDVDLGHALGQVLGVKFVFSNTGFDGIIPSLGTRYDLGMSSFTDTKAREKVVDMVTYFSAGTSLMVAKGNPAGITGADMLCGKKAAAEKGTVQLDDLAARSKKCTAAGKPAIKVSAYPDQSGANLALASNRVDVVLADSPVLEYAVKQSNGQFQLVGSAYDTAPYGIAVPKSAPYQGFSQAILAGVKKLMANGTYKQVLDKWGIGAGAISNPQINGAKS